MIDDAALGALIPRLISRPRRGTFFRAMQSRYHTDPLGKRRPIARQRFNVANGARILYLGDDQVTCLYEVQAFGFPAQWITTIPVELRLNAVLDLRDAGLRGSIHVTTSDVNFNFRSVAVKTDMQRLGEALAASGRVDGLVYESLARPGNVCLAVFEAGVAALGSAIEVLDNGKLVDRLP